jgi:hypothetical protein
VTGAATAHAALSDNADGTYIRKAASGTASIVLGNGTVSIGAAQVVRQVRVRARCKGGDASTKANLYLGARVEGLNYFTTAVPLRGNAAIGEIAGPWQAVAPDGQAWDQERIDEVRAQWTDYRDGASRAYLYEVYVDVDLASEPTTAVTAPTGTVTTTSRPDVSWTYTDTESEAQTYYRIKVYPGLVYTAGGFDPEVGVPTWDSGVVSSTDTAATVGAYLPNGEHRVYVKTAKTINGSPFWSGWAYSEFTVQLTPPPLPSISLEYLPAEGAVVCTVTGGPPTGFDSQLFDVERSDDNGATWLPVRNGTGLTPSGTYTAVVKDYEAPRGVAVLYRARTVGTLAGNQVASAWGGDRPWEVLARQATFYIDASVAPGGQSVPNQGTGGSALDARLGSTTGADSNDPLFLAWPGHNGGNYVYLPGVGSNFLSVPDAAALDLAGDMDVVVHAALDDWTRDNVLVARWQGDTSFWFQTNSLGYLRLFFRVSATQYARDSGTAVPFADGSPGWVRFTRSATTGDLKFYTSTDGVTWSQLGATQTSPAGAIDGSASTLNVGEYGFEGLPLGGKVYRAIYRDGIDGSAVVDIDTSLVTSGAATSFTAVTGQTVTINRRTSGRKAALVTRPVWLFGTDDYMEVADNALLDFGATDSFTALVVARQWNTQSFTQLLSKIEGQSAIYNGWTLYTNSTTLGLQIADATNGPADTQAYSTGALHTVAGVRNVSADTLATYVNGTATTLSTDTTTGSLANSLSMRVGRLAGAGTSYTDMEVYGAALFRRALTAAEISALTTGFASATNTYPSLTVPNDGTWWWKVPTVPALTVSAVPVLAGVGVEQQAQVGVFRPIGRDRAVVIEGGRGGWDGTYEVAISSDADWAALETLLEARATILVQDPFGYQKYVRLVSRNVTLLGTPDAPQRRVSVSYVEVDS